MLVHGGDSPQLNSPPRSDWNASPVSLKTPGNSFCWLLHKKVQNGSTCAIVVATDIFCAIAR